MHPPVSVTNGACTNADILTIAAVFNARLQTSSQSTLQSVVTKHWLPFCQLHSTALLGAILIPAGSPFRGGIMASFALFLANKKLKFATIQGYIWATCEHHIQNGGIAMDPLDNVQDWSRFMNALEVQSWVDSSVDPHEMVPFQLFVRTLSMLDVTSHADVLLGIILVFMYHTMSRSETPVPKTRSGQHNFDQEQHIRCKDVRLLRVSPDLIIVEWGFGHFSTTAGSCLCCAEFSYTYAIGYTGYTTSHFGGPFTTYAIGYIIYTTSH